MRNNLPVTNVEIQLDAHTLIVSKTDLKGQITYINKDFIDISGFTEAELIGQPHNIVRHPDMPVEAYIDMWADLKDGRPWTGLVKTDARMVTTIGLLPTRRLYVKMVKWLVLCLSVARSVRSRFRLQMLPTGQSGKNGLAGWKSGMARWSAGAMGAVRRWLSGAPSSQKIVLGMLAGFSILIGIATTLLGGTWLGCWMIRDAIP